MESMIDSKITLESAREFATIDSKIVLESKLRHCETCIARRSNPLFEIKKNKNHLINFN